ncbi:MAG: hypothetical protein Q4G07_01170 [Oscillospiraceae bacterium]|nr:hypothetical protein [Oscillospiraceae bacterium]
MKSIIEALFNGGVSPIDSFCPALESYQKKWKEALARDDDFFKKLPPELQEEFERLMDEHFSLLPLEMSEIYAQGFKLGARLSCEIFSSDDGLGLVSSGTSSGALS